MSNLLYMRRLTLQTARRKYHTLDAYAIGGVLTGGVAAGVSAWKRYEEIVTFQSELPYIRPFDGMDILDVATEGVKYGVIMAVFYPVIVPVIGCVLLTEWGID